MIFSLQLVHSDSLCSFYDINTEDFITAGFCSEHGEVYDVICLDGVHQSQPLVRDKPDNFKSLNKEKLFPNDQFLLVDPELCGLRDDDHGVVGQAGRLYLDQLVTNKLK